jgi:methanogenic corrinoid protein MtbC1
MPRNAAGIAASKILKERREAIAERVATLFWKAYPQLEKRWHAAWQKTTQDNSLLDYLSEALSLGRSSLFTEYVVWVAVLLTGQDFPGMAVGLNLKLIRTILVSELSDAGGAMATQYLDTAIAAIERGVSATRTHLGGNEPIDFLARDYLSALLRGDRHVAMSLVLAAADGGTSIKDIYLFIFQRVLQELGRLWHFNQISVAQEHYCTGCTQLIMSQLYPRIFSTERNGLRLVSTCVGGDLHELGLRMLSDFFEMEGWDTFYLGANTPTSGTLQQVAERRPHVLAISATLSVHVKSVADLIAATRAAGRPPRILVGGSPFNSLPGLWKDVGADGYARDAAEAIAVAGAWNK